MFSKSGLLSRYDGHLGKLNYAWQENTDASGSEPGGQVSLISWHSYFGLPIISTNCQESSPFEALISAQLSKSHMDVRPSVQKRLSTMVFSRVSTGDSDIPSSCEMKNEPALKALQGKPAFFESGHLGVHFTGVRKHGGSLTYIFLRVGSS